jgi:hypothetical protein
VFPVIIIIIITIVIIIIIIVLLQGIELSISMTKLSPFIERL